MSAPAIELFHRGARFETWRGDCLAVLRQLPSGEAHAIVTDPPSGIAFMGHEWDTDKGGRDAWVAWLAEVLKEAMRVLKPGGYALVWALPRTSHWTATAVEDAGFELRDVIMHVFGSGFPKNLDVSKAIDEHLAPPCSKCNGARKVWRNKTTLEESAAMPACETDDERDAWESVKCEPCRGKGKEPMRALKRVPYTGDALMRHDGENTRPWMEEALARGYAEVADDEPATPEAATWQGWGTALKPAAEHWILARKPLEESSVAANVLEHGTGAINIDGCRIGEEERFNPPTHKSETASMGSFANCEGKGSWVAGRWPANFVLSHAAGCELLEVKRIKSALAERHDGLTVPLFDAVEEKVEVWQCVPDCPVDLIDRQSGKSGGAPARSSIAINRHEGVKVFNSSVKHNFTYGDEGGASRFFYVAKPSNGEKNDGLDELEDRILRRVNSGGLENDPRWAPVVTKNHHSTVKPVTLMAYLCRLITPPGGTILDPFMGSGTTGVAAMREGFRFVGIEQNPEYIEIATARVRHAEERPHG